MEEHLMDSFGKQSIIQQNTKLSQACLLSSTLCIKLERFSLKSQSHRQSVTT